MSHFLEHFFKLKVRHWIIYCVYRPSWWYKQVSAITYIMAALFILRYVLDLKWLKQKLITTEVKVYRAQIVSLMEKNQYGLSDQPQFPLI